MKQVWLAALFPNPSGYCKYSKETPGKFKCWSQIWGSSVISVFVNEFAHVFMALSWKVCNFKCITRGARRHAGQGLPQEKVPAGYVRISPSLSCNTEFPSIMFLSMLLACPVENAWKCGTNAIVSPWPWSKGFLSRRTGQLYWGYSWPGVDGSNGSLFGVLEPLSHSLTLCQWIGGSE